MVRRPSVTPSPWPRRGEGRQLSKVEDKDGVKVVVRNRRATFLYEILDRIEVGIVLVGTEVKSLRSGKISLADAYAALHGQELFLHNLHIGAYDKASADAHDPLRRRKLLLHRREIRRLMVKIQERGLTLVPLQIYFRQGRAKVELGLVRGKKKYDKREAIAKRDLKRDLERARGRGERE